MPICNEVAMAQHSSVYLIDNVTIVPRTATTTYPLMLQEIMAQI